MLTLWRKDRKHGALGTDRLIIYSKMYESKSMTIDSPVIWRAIKFKINYIHGFAKHVDCPVAIYHRYVITKQITSLTYLVNLFQD